MNPRRRRIDRHRRKDRAACLAVGCTVHDWATGVCVAVRFPGPVLPIVLRAVAPSAEMRRDRLLPDITFPWPVICLKV